MSSLTSSLAIRRAAALGSQMAKAECLLAPDLEGAHTYPNYLLFIQAHRLRLEHMRMFAPWEAKLSSLIEQEQEAGGRGLSEIRSWDELHTEIEVPMRCAFWYAWETTVDLRKRYEECVALERERTRRMRIFSTAAGAVLAVGPESRGEQEV